MHNVVMQDHRASPGHLVSLEPLERQVSLVIRANQDKRASQDQQGFVDSREQLDSRDSQEWLEVPDIQETQGRPERRGHLDLRDLLEQLGLLESLAILEVREVLATAVQSEQLDPPDRRVSLETRVSVVKMVSRALLVSVVQPVQVAS